MGVVPLPRVIERLRLVLLVCFCVHLFGCSVERAPELLDIQEVSPPTLEPGATLEVSGTSFPERQSGTLTLVGNVFTPAREARALNVSWPVVAESRSRLEIQLTDKALSAVTEGAPHVTFRGKLSLEFAALRAGGPVLRGESSDVVLDVFSEDPRGIEPPVSESFASFLGMALSEGLEIIELSVDGEAARAGLLVGDRLLVLDGVRLDSRHDFYPAVRARVSTIEFSREGHVDLGTAVVDRSAYQPLAPSAAARALVLVLGFVCALLVAARPPAWLLWLFVRRSSKRGEDLASTRPRGSQLSWFEHAVFLSVVLSLWLVLGGSVPRLSGFELLLSAGVLSLVFSAFLEGGRRSGGASRKFSVLGGLFSVLCAGVLFIPLIAAVVLRTSEIGSLRLSELQKGQGLSPLDWALFESPWALLLGLAYLACLVPGFGRRPPVEDHQGQPRRRGFAGFFSWFGLLSLVAVWVVLFLGGDSGTRPGSVLAGFLLSCKVALVVQLVLGLRRSLGHLRAEEAFGFWSRGALAWSLLGALLFGASLWSGVFDAHFELLGQGVVVVSCVFAVLLALSASRALRHSGRTADPWI